MCNHTGKDTQNIPFPFCHTSLPKKPKYRLHGSISPFFLITANRYMSIILETTGKWETIFIFLFPSFLSSRATNYMWRCAANRLEIASVYTQNFGLCFTSAIWQRGNSPRFSKSSISWAMRSRRDCPMPSVRHFWRWVSWPSSLGRWVLERRSKLILPYGQGFRQEEEWGPKIKAVPLLPSLTQKASPVGPANAIITSIITSYNPMPIPNPMPPFPHNFNINKINFYMRLNIWIYI